MLGNYEHRIDQKGRVAIPAKFRKEFAEGVVLTSGVDQCIIAYPASEWQKLSESYNLSPFSSSKNRDLTRFIFGNASNVELDRQGRVAIPFWLRQHARIEEAAMIIGVNRYLEIWSRENWEQESLRIREEAWNLAERSGEN
ncbi:MAG: division/cell wall cluster transcriptional repressor MraZ [Dehalococcoidia bacterium]